MSESHTPRSLDDVLDGIRFAMVATYEAGALKARPLAVQEVDGSTIRFLVSTSAEWVRALGAGGSPALLTFAQEKGNTWVAVEGTARELDDRATVARLYDPVNDAFFDGVDDPQIRVLEVQVERGEWWDGPSGRLGQALGILGTKLTGDTKKAGDQGPVQV